MASADRNAAFDVDVAIVGGGPAGVAAASAVSEFGLKCLIMERSPALGGQILAIQSKESGASQDREAERTEALGRRLTGLGVEVITGAAVWNAEPSGVLHLAQGPFHHRVRCRALVVATGARERPMPFMRWTLPGVITCGAAQRLIAQSGVLPGHRVMVAGRGALLLRAAADLIDAGVRVVAFVEATRVAQLAAGGLRSVLLSPDRAGQAARFARTLLGAGIPMHFGQVVVEAGGRERIERVTLAAAKDLSHPELSRRQTYSVDALCISNGLEPNIELFHALGCEVAYGGEAQAFYPRLCDTLRTSVPWVYAAGEVTGIGGAAKSLVEGEIAGIQAALDLKAVPKEKVAVRLSALMAQRRKLLARSLWMERAYIGPDVFLRLADPETIACRCEEITLREIREAIKEGDGSPRDVKLRTRAGMGMCQGRMCLSTLYRELASAPGHAAQSMVPVRCRPPLEPVPLGWLAEHVTSESVSDGPA